MMPEIDDVAWIVVGRAGAVGIAFGADAIRVRPPLPRWAQPVAVATAATSSNAENQRLTRSALSLPVAHRGHLGVEVALLRGGQYAADPVHERAHAGAAGLRIRGRRLIAVLRAHVLA